MRNASSENTLLRSRSVRTNVATISVLVGLAVPVLLGAKGGCGDDYVSLGSEGGEGGETSSAGDGHGGGISPEAGRPQHGGAPSGGGGPSRGGAPNGGSVFGGGPNATAGSGAAGGGNCYSPAVNPELALNLDAQGCACTAGEACVTVQDQGGPHSLALICSEGRWESVEDGPCGQITGRGAACKVFGRVYLDGSTYVPDAHSCNICSCDDGELTNCTKIDCPMPCPPNGLPSRQCAECGPADECLVVEHTCLPVCTEDDHCNGAACISGTCRNVCG